MRVVGIAGPSIFTMESDRYISVLTSSWTALERPCLPMGPFLKGEFEKNYSLGCVFGVILLRTLPW